MASKGSRLSTIGKQLKEAIDTGGFRKPEEKKEVKEKRRPRSRRIALRDVIASLVQLKSWKATGTSREYRTDRY